jgi:hypothetical protein
MPHEARHGTLPGQVTTGAQTMWLRYVGGRSAAQAIGGNGLQGAVRSQLLPAFRSLTLEQVTPGVIERWLSSLNESCEVACTAARGSSSGRKGHSGRVGGIPVRSASRHGLRISGAARSCRS